MNRKSRQYDSSKKSICLIRNGVRTYYYPKNRFEIRRKNYERRHHPAIIVGSNKREFAGFGLTSSKKNGTHSNIALMKNPNPISNKTSYVKVRPESYAKKDMSAPLNWKLDPRDEQTIQKILLKYSVK